MHEISLQQDRKCTYNVTLRRAIVPIVAVEEKWALHNLRVCICSLRCPACTTHAPYFHLWPAPFYNIFSTLSHKRHDFRKKKLLNTKCVLILSTIFVWNISHSKKKWARYYKKCILVFMLSTLYSCPILKKLEFSPQIFETSSNVKCRENPPSGGRVVPCGRTDGHDEANSRVSQFC
jgi:hypothetical protein